MNKAGNAKALAPYQFKHKWQNEETTVIRIPAALKEQILQIARELDAGNYRKPTASTEGLKAALGLKANAGGAIKQAIREYLNSM